MEKDIEIKEIIESEEEHTYPPQYDIIVSPSDFNVITLYNSIEKGIIKIPGFQRNYVWDIRTASRFIESILIGLPIPQIFLFEFRRNEYIVVDGLQRLMTIYFFIKGRFPKYEKRGELRKRVEGEIRIDENLLSNDNYFEPFILRLRNDAAGMQSRFHSQSYESLENDTRGSFEIRPIRTVVITPLKPDDTSIMYEIFSRLNTGGIKLNYQEIRNAIYYSEFIRTIIEINNNHLWRKLYGSEIDPRMEDVEALIRGFAMLIRWREYKPPMYGFLDAFCKDVKNGKIEIDVRYVRALVESFFASCEPTLEKLKEKPFYLSNKFSVMLYEVVFVAVCERFYKERKLVDGYIDYEFIEKLKSNEKFRELTSGKTTSKSSVLERIKIAIELYEKHPLKRL